MQTLLITLIHIDTKVTFMFEKKITKILIFAPKSTSRGQFRSFWVDVGFEHKSEFCNNVCLSLVVSCPVGHLPLLYITLQSSSIPTPIDYGGSFIPSIFRQNK